MGFFKEADILLERGLPRAPTPAKQKGKRGFADVPRGCASCPLQRRHAALVTPKMPLTGNTSDADILILGEAPGEQEDYEGRAFVGDSGKMLAQVIPGIEGHRLAYQNTVRCHPPHNDTPTPLMAHACSVFLEEDIGALPFKAILGVGSVPLSRFLPGQAITRVHGTWFPVEVRGQVLWYFPVIHPSYVIRTGGARESHAFPILRADVRKFFQELDRKPSPRIYKPEDVQVIYPTTYAEARELVDRMRPMRAIDLETTNLRPYIKDSLILTGAISDGRITIAFSVDHPEQRNPWGLRLLLEVAGDPATTWGAHNAVMELTWLLFKAQEAGIPFEPSAFSDSMACLRLYHERETILGLDLGTRIHLGWNVKDQHSNLDMGGLIFAKLSDVLHYNGLDAWASARLISKLEPQVHARNYARLLGAIRSTAQMELLGLEIDPDANKQQDKEWLGIIEKARKDASKLYEVRAWQDATQKEFNIGSPEQVGEALVKYGRVMLPEKEGKRSTDDKALKEHAEGNPLAECTIRFREATKMRSTYVLPIQEAMRIHIDGRLHPSYSTMLVASGRLSSQDPNIQNFPKRRHKELRSQIRAPRGYVLASFDYGQLEARTFAMGSRCVGLCASIIKKIDIHAKWRDRSLELHPPYYERLKDKTNQTKREKVLSGGRDIIKTDFVFASFFGSDANACASRTGMPLHITQALLREFWEEYPGAAKYVKQCRTLYRETGNAVLLTGMVRHALLSGNEPINTPVQGTGAHIVIEAQNALCERAIKERDPNLFPRINIHDDLTFILPDDDEALSYYIPLIADELVAVRFPFQIVPLKVDCSVGYAWSDLEHIASFEGTYIE